VKRGWLKGPTPKYARGSDHRRLTTASK